MPWVDVVQDFAQPPRLRDPRPDGVYPGALDVDDGFAELADHAVIGTTLEPFACVDFSVRSSTLNGVTVAADPSPILDVHNSRFESCDLSRVRFGALRETTLADSKLVGADFAGARLDDVVFERCTLRYANFRQAEISRVRFVDCVLDDVDMFEARLEDVSVPDSNLRSVSIDRVRTVRVDLRGANSLGLEAIGRLEGCLVTELQLHELLYGLAFASGLGVERPDTDGSESCD